MRAIFLGLLLAFLPGCTDEAPPPRAPAADGTTSAVLERITRPGEGGAVHLVRLVQRGDEYSFVPATISIRRGDVLRFVLDGPQPESVAFDTTAATPPVAAYIRENALHRGVLLVEPGQAFDVSFREAPTGRYPFFSVPHSERGMRGAVEIPEP